MEHPGLACKTRSFNFPTDPSLPLIANAKWETPSGLVPLLYMLSDDFRPMGFPELDKIATAFILKNAVALSTKQVENFTQIGGVLNRESTDLASLEDALIDSGIKNSYVQSVLTLIYQAKELCRESILGYQVGLRGGSAGI